MSLLLEYLDWRGDISFDVSPENEVDAVFMTQIVMLSLNGLVDAPITLNQFAKTYFEKELDKVSLGVIYPSLLNEMLAKMQNSARFSQCVLSNFLNQKDEDKQMQITAVTIDTATTRYVVFAGTGDTLVSWRENFNLIYKTPTPSQIMSVQYLENAILDTNKRVVVCGHSKGGHLAMYSALHCNPVTQSKVSKVYNIDGPGLSEKEWEEVKSTNMHLKITALFPECSIVGRLFDHYEETDIVACDSIGLYQHDCFNWHVGATCFVKKQEFDKESDDINNLVRGILSTMDEEQRSDFVEAFYAFLYGTESTTLTEVTQNKKKIFSSYNKLPPEGKKVLFSIGLKLLRDATTRKLVSKSIREALNTRKAK